MDIAVNIAKKIIDAASKELALTRLAYIVTTIAKELVGANKRVILGAGKSIVGDLVESADGTLLVSSEGSHEVDVIIIDDVNTGAYISKSPDETEIRVFVPIPGQQGEFLMSVITNVESDGTEELDDAEEVL